MADGRHFENRYIAVSQWKIIRFSWNFVHSSIFWTGWTSRDQKMKKLHWTESEFDRTYFLFFFYKFSLLFTGLDSESCVPTNQKVVQESKPPNKWLRVYWQVFVCSAESAKSRQHYSLATVWDADMKLRRCVGDKNVGRARRWVWYSVSKLYPGRRGWSDLIADDFWFY